MDEPFADGAINTNKIESAHLTLGPVVTDAIISSFRVSLISINCDLLNRPFGVNVTFIDLVGERVSVPFTDNCEPMILEDSKTLGS